MKRIIITLCLAIGVFLITLLITNSYISNKSATAADNMVMLKMDSFCDDFDGDLLMTKNVVYGFLAGNLIADSTRSADCFFVDEDKMRFFDRGLQEHLAAFLSTNPYYVSAMFIIQKDSARQSYYAPLLTQGADHIVDFALRYDFSHSEALDKCRTTMRSFWNQPTVQEGKKIVCFYVPICRKHDGSFLGAFTIALNISTIDRKIERHLPYGKKDSEMVIIDDKGEIVSAFPYVYQNYSSYSELYNTVLKHVTTLEEDTVKGRIIIDYKGTKYFQYQRKLKCAPWTIVTGCKSSAVYAESDRLQNVVLITSFIGMLLMLVSCIVVMMQIYRTHRRKEAAEHELNMASRVQMSLLRKRDNESRQYAIHAFIQPAREAGGDLYDYVQIDGRLIFCIGDVSGKGMPAALFMTQVMSLFRSAVKHSTEPSFILNYINEVMADDNPDMTFCTIIVATLDGTTLTVANAGHNRPLLLQGLATPQFLPTESDMPIGIEPDNEYFSETFTLNVGDTLMLYTDGVTEAMDKSRQQYGEQRMIEALASRTANTPQHTTDILLASVTGFVNEAEQSDDITVLAISNKGGERQ